MRSAVANTDDPTMPAGTLRAWILGLIWAIVIPGVNQFYFFRYPSVTIGPVRLPCVRSVVPLLTGSSAHSLWPNYCHFPSVGYWLDFYPQSKYSAFKSILDRSLSRSTL